MPVYNAGRYLDAAVESILAQTLTNFRFAIFDDGSTDGSYERALAWAQRDARIVVQRGAVRSGVTAGAQSAAAMAETEFVARMDADDVAYPERLAEGLAALRANPAAVLVGSLYELIDGDNRILRGAEAYRILCPTPPFAHATIMYRNRAFREAGGYRIDSEYFEDQDLYRRLAPLGEILVINRPLLGLRHAGQNFRLRHAALDMVRQIDRQYGEGTAIPPPRAKVSPLAFYSLAVLAILAAERPRSIGPMLAHSRFWPPRLYLGVAAMIAVAELSPRLARAIGRLRMVLREAVARRRLVPGAVYRWPLRQSARVPARRAADPGPAPAG